MTDRGLREIRVPQLGEGLREARVVELLREPGSTLRRGDPLYVIETDKTTVELEVPFDGLLVEWRVAAGDVVAIDTTIAMITPAPGESNVGVASTLTERLIPPRTRHYAQERGIDAALLASITSTSNKLLPQDIDAYLARETPLVPAAIGYREQKVVGGHRALIFRLRRSATLVIPGTIAVAVLWNFLASPQVTGQGPKATPFQVFGHAVAQVAQRHPQFRSVMLGDDRIREYDHINVGIAMARPNDELIIAVIRAAERMTLQDFVRACNAQMRRAIREGDQAAEDTQILLSHLGEFGIPDAVPTLVAPASSVLFLGTPAPGDDNARIVLTFDHRLINGAAAGRFLSELAAYLTRR